MARTGRELGLLWGAVAVALTALAPLGERLTAGLPDCVFRALAGLPCLTCGATRAALALAQLDPVAALSLNPLATLGWLVLVGGGWIAGLAALAGRPLSEPALRLSAWQRLGVVAVLLGNWAYLIAAGT